MGAKSAVPATYQDRLALLYRVSETIGSTPDLDRALNQVLDAISQLTGAERGFLMVVDVDTGRLNFQAGRNVDRTAIQNREMEIGRKVVRQVVETGAPVLTSNAQQDPRFSDQPGTIDYCPRSVMCAPLWVRGKITGAVYVDNCFHSGLFAPDDLATLSALANQVAMAIDNARLYRAAAAATEAKSTFVSVVSHELRIPMTSIKGYTDMLRQGAVGSFTEMQLGFLDTIRRNVDRMSVLVADLSDINRIESGRLSLTIEALDLGSIVRDTVSGLEDRFVEKGQELSIELGPELASVYGDRSRVAQMLTILLSNANQYSPAGRPIVVNAERIKDGGRLWARLQVSDRGYGISQDDQDRLFSQFFRSEDPNIRNEAGWGLGLSLVKMLAEAQGGCVSVESKLGFGSTFGFILPMGVE